MRQQEISDEEHAGDSPSPAKLRQVSSTKNPTDQTINRNQFNKVHKIFPNGDIYTGGFAGNCPEGFGKCDWIDGSVYEGEWREGNAAGEGKFTWPSGAIYEGEFKDGRIEGFGTFVGADGETYEGSWISDQKHGFGKKLYANGDFYEGQWKRDVQEGQGRYVWKDGIQYFGEWRNGMICGRGVLILANGDLRDGEWKNGVAKRNGGFVWPDWRCNFGNRSRDFRDQIQYSVSLSLDNEESVDGVFARRRKGEEILGSIISKDHKSYDLVQRIQAGIRYSVGKTLSKKKVKLWPSDFNPGEKFWTMFPLEGSNCSRTHHSAEFKWKDYCPNVFRHLRKLFGVDPADYINAICGTDFLREFPSPGKSGSLIFLTQDDRFIIKTVRKSEVKMLIKMLLNYHQHVRQYENSLLTKFYGVHCVKPIGGHKVRFIVMGNLLCSDHGIHRRFDLKGSSHGRTVYKSEKFVDQTSTLKDLDLNFVFHLQKPWFKNFMWQIERDCEFLEGEGIMDYSLLVGVHFTESKMATNYSTSQQASGADGSFQGQRPLIDFFPNFGKGDRDRRMNDREQIRLGASVPARAKRVSHGNDNIYEVVLYFGIIDILRDYNFTKKIEHAYKSLQVDPYSISAVDPKHYSKRFLDFITTVFVKDG